MGFIEGVVVVVIAYWVTKSLARIGSDVWHNFVMKPLYDRQSRREHEEWLKEQKEVKAVMKSKKKK